MIILAWNGGTPSDIFDAGVFKQVLSIFITAAVLKLGQGILHHPSHVLFARHRFFARELSSCYRTLICRSN